MHVYKQNENIQDNKEVIESQLNGGTLVVGTDDMSSEKCAKEQMNFVCNVPMYH